MAGVRFTVLLDDRVAWSSPWLRGPGATADVALDVTGGRQLALAAETEFSAGSRAVWLDPQLAQLSDAQCALAGVVRTPS